MTGRVATFRRRVVRPVVLLPLAVLVGGGGWLALRSGKSSAATSTVVERTVDVTSGPLAQAVSASGTLAPADVENLNFAVSGQVTAVNVTAGQQVTKGTVLATIDSATLQNQVSQAQATVDTDQARLATDTANSASTAQLNADNANIAAAQAALTQAQAALAGATLTAPIDGTVSAVNLTVGEQLGSSGTGGTSLTGSGTGSGRNAASSSSSSGGQGTGSSGSSSAGQIQLVSTGSYIVNLSVDDTQIGLLKTGQAAVISRTSAAVAGTGGRAGRLGTGAAAGAAPTGANGQLPANGQPGTGGANGAAGTNGASGANGTGGANGAAGGSGRGRAGAAAPVTTGTVTSVGTIATSTSGVSSFPVVVSISGNQTDLFAGATVQVSIAYNEIADAVQVPTAAVTFANGQSSVMVVNGNSRVRTPVRTGLVAGGQTQVLQGLTAGQQVAVTVTVPAGTTATTNRNGTGGIFGGGNGGGTGGTRFGGGTGGGAGGGAGGFTRGAGG